MAILRVPAPTGGDDQALVQGVFDSAAAGDEIVFPSGNPDYRHSGKLVLQNKPDVYIHAADNGQFTLTATNVDACSVHIWSNSHRLHVKGMRARTLGATQRLNNGFQNAGIIIDYADYVWTEDCISEGAPGLGWYLFNANYGKHDRPQVLSSGADGIHLTYGSHHNVITDAWLNNVGDDFCPEIGYLNDGEAGRPHHNTWIRPVGRNGHARGAAFAGAYDSVCQDPDFTDTRAASIMFACERGDFNTMPTERCKVTGGRARRSQIPKPVLGSTTNDSPVHAGPILYASALATTGVVDCVVDGLSVGDFTGNTSAVAQQSGAMPAGTSGVVNLKMYAGTPTQLWQGTQVGSTATWTDMRSQTMAATATAPVSSGPSTAPSSILPGATFGTVSASGVGRGSVEAISGTLTVMKADSLGAVADGAAVTAWADKKGRWNLVAGNAAPTKVAAGALGGKPAVRFNGTSQDLRMANAPALAQPFTIGIVLAPTTVTGDRQLIWQGNGGETAIYQSRYFLYSGTGGTITSPVPTTGGKVLTYEHNGPASSLNVNGALGSPGTVSPGTNGMTPATLYVMNHGTVTRYFGGDLYEIRVWDHQLSDAEETAWHSYCQDEYGVTVADYVAPATPPTTATPAAKSSGAALGQPAVAPGPVRVTPRPAFSIDPDGAVVGQITATPGDTAAPPSIITSTSLAGQPYAEAGPVTAGPSTAPSSASVGQLVAAPGSVSGAPGTRAPTAMLGQPAASTGAVGTSPATIPAGSALGVPAGLAGDVTSVPATVLSGAVLGQPVTSAGAVSGTPPGAAPTAVVSDAFATIVPTNLVTNPSFEPDGAGHTATRVVAERTVEAANGSSFGMRLTVNAVGYFPRIDSLNISVTPGAVYNISAWMRSTGNVRIALATDTGALLSSAAVASNGQWVRYSRVYTVPSGRTVIRLQLGVPDNAPVGTVVDIDRIQMTQGSTLFPYSTASDYPADALAAAPYTVAATSSTGTLTATGGSVTATPATRGPAVVLGSTTASPGVTSVAVPALDSTSRTGAVTAAGGAAGVLPASAPSGTVLGQPVAVAGAASAAPSSVPSTSSTGTPTAAAGQLVVAAGAVTSGGALGTPTATSSLSRTPTPRTAATSFGIVVVSSTLLVSPATIAPGARSGATSAGAGPYVVVVASAEPTSVVGSVSAERRGGTHDIDVTVGVPRLAVYILAPHTAWRAAAPVI